METINPQNLLLAVTDILARLNIKYFVTGGMAVSVWGRPRATFDIDIVIELVELKTKLLVKALRQISAAGYVDEATAKKALARQGEFNFIDGETGLKVDFWITKTDEFSRAKLKQKKAKVIDGKTVYFISPEDLILSKLQWYQKSQSSRQLEDVASILNVAGGEFDRAYLEKWAEKLGVAEILKEAGQD